MLLNRVLPKAKKHFPDLKIKFKDESALMKFIGAILFFNKGFMTNFTSTIGSTIYFPSKKRLEDKKYMAFATLFHEMIHIWDSKQNKLFKFLYLFPQILTLLLIPLLFLLSWKVVIPAMILCALPLPAYFRMNYEKRAYFISLYVVHNLGKKLNSYRIIDSYKDKCKKHFTGANYYFMWMFPSLRNEFDEMVEKIKNDEKPLDGEIMDIIDELMSKVFTKV